MQDRELFEAWWAEEAGTDIAPDILKRICDKAWETNDITVRAFLAGRRAQASAEPVGHAERHPIYGRPNRVIAVLPDGTAPGSPVFASPQPDEVEVLRSLVGEMLALSDNWPGIAYSHDLETRARAALGAKEQSHG